MYGVGGSWFLRKLLFDSLAQLSVMRIYIYIEKLLKSDGFVNVEILSNTGELGIVSSRNNVDSFLPEKKNDIEMTDRTSERGMMSCKNKRARLSVGDIIDRISRLLFPLAFISFNVSYWNHYLSK